MLEGLHYQNAYVCDDLDAGIDMFRGRGLAREPVVIAVDQQVLTPQGLRHQKSCICFIWIGDLQYELIESEVDEAGIHAARPVAGGPLHFHHACFRVADWDAFRARVDRQPLPVAMERAESEGDALRFLYLDARSVLGHYLEYTWMPDAMWERLRAM